MTDLEKLVAAVEAGESPGDFVLSLPDQKTTDLFYSASRGSLDAALALFNALLPGWRWDASNWGKVEVRTRETQEDSTHPKMSAQGFARDNPARALLLATLRAYAKQEQQK